jgi:hypothetical protein
MNSKSSTGIALIFAVTLTLVGCGSGGSSTTTARVGPAGATLRSGALALTIPAGALASDVQLTLREAEPHHLGRATRIEIEPHGLELEHAARLSVQVDDSNGRVRMMEVENEIEHVVEVEIEDHARHAYKTRLARLGSIEVEVEHARVCAVTCAANEECDDGVCKPHVEHVAGASCDPVCDAGLECDDGMCKPHGGAVSTPGATAACIPGCAAGLECDDGICKPHRNP